MRFKHSGSILVIVLMSIFALGGTTYGMWEETLGFFALLVPLVLALKYDRIVAASIIFLGAGTGVSRPPSTRSRRASRPTPPASTSATGSS